MQLTKLEKELMACLRQFRAMHNKCVIDAREAAKLHQKADALLAMDPAEDDRKNRYDDPGLVKHRQFVDRMFSPERF